MLKNKMEVDFGLLNDMCSESSLSYDEVIANLEMAEVPMSKTVRKLGVILGILYA